MHPRILAKRQAAANRELAEHAAALGAALGIEDAAEQVTVASRQDKKLEGMHRVEGVNALLAKIRAAQEAAEQEAEPERKPRKRSKKSEEAPDGED